MNLIQRIMLKDKIQACLAQKCAELTKQSEQIINEEVEKRKHMEQSKTPYSSSKEDYMKNRYFNLERSLIVEEAEHCISACQRPAEIIKRVLGQNFKEIQDNIQLCCRDCEKLDT